MRSYYLLPWLCLTFCAVAKCGITTSLDCQTEKLVGETKNSPTGKTAIDYYCSDGALANYDEQSARYHCCLVPLRQGKCPGECRKLRSKRSLGGPPWISKRSAEQPAPEPQPEPEPQPAPQPQPIPTTHPYNPIWSN